jgi:hypothetical protein
LGRRGQDGHGIVSSEGRSVVPALVKRSTLVEGQGMLSSHVGRIAPAATEGALALRLPHAHSCTSHARPADEQRRHW